jgi:hypothetical protein
MPTPPSTAPPKVSWTAAARILAGRAAAAIHGRLIAALGGEVERRAAELYAGAAESALTR